MSAGVEPLTPQWDHLRRVLNLQLKRASGPAAHEIETELRRMDQLERIADGAVRELMPAIEGRTAAYKPPAS